jgi:hypothetical protein
MQNLWRKSNKKCCSSFILHISFKRCHSVFKHSFRFQLDHLDDNSYAINLLGIPPIIIELYKRWRRPTRNDIENLTVMFKNIYFLIIFLFDACPALGYTFIFKRASNNFFCFVFYVTPTQYRSYRDVAALLVEEDLRCPFVHYFRHERAPE